MLVDARRGEASRGDDGLGTAEERHREGQPVHPAVQQGAAPLGGVEEPRSTVVDRRPTEVGGEHAHVTEGTRAHEIHGPDHGR